MQTIWLNFRKGIWCPPSTSARTLYSYEFDSAHRLLHLLYRNRVDEETLRQACVDNSRIIASTGAKLLIEDFSAVENFDVSADAVRQLGETPPGGQDLQTTRVIVAPRLHIFGLARLFEVHATDAMPKVAVVRNLEEAFVILCVREPRFVPVDSHDKPATGTGLFI